MHSILEACQPRPNILTGSFNPEIFTANISQVFDSYRRKEGSRKISTPMRRLSSEKAPIPPRV
jgi:hypothetical protein